jgi:hypothetical protein
MDPEFRALGVDRHSRGRITDDTLEFLRRCFDAEDDVVSENGQDFYFRPRPTRPKILIGGGAPHALRRAVRYGDGWIPMTGDPEKLRPAVEQLHALASEAGVATPEVACMGGLPGDPGAAAGQLRVLEEIGVTRFLTGAKYESDPSPFYRSVDSLLAARKAFGD